MRKVLFLIDHATNYREAFFGDLAKYYELTVAAHPCEKDNLIPPKVRGEYEYVELRRTFGANLRFNFELYSLIQRCNPDVICIALNLRYPVRVATFLFNKTLRKKWIWWGHIFGKSNNRLLLNLKLFLIRKAHGTLVYTDDIKNRIKGNNVISFNNSQFRAKDYTRLDNVVGESLNCLYVGRAQKRKRLELLVAIARQRKDLNFRFVGPLMEKYFDNCNLPANIQIYGAATGSALQEHFRWSNIVVCPGSVGLLVMNAACHQRPIALGSSVKHGPESILAKEADQFFVDFSSKEEVNWFFNSLIQDRNQLLKKGEDLFNKGLTKYTIEQMVINHRRMFDSVHSD